MCCKYLKKIQLKSMARIDILKIIVGLAGRDTSTNNSYPVFILRTFMAHCENQPLGIISYGGAIFQGRINCCWKNNCNTESKLI